MTAPEAQRWLNAVRGGDNVLQLADSKTLSECDLKTLGCQGVRQLEGGVWHLLFGDKAPSLSGALEAFVNRNEVREK